MLSDTSSSSGEDEETNQTAVPTRQKVARENAYKCPDDFVSFTHKPCSSTLSDSLKNKNCELWLIKAPSSFNPERFNGVAVPLSGLQTLRVPAAAPGSENASGRQGLYSVLGSNRSPGELHLLTAAGTTAASDRVVCGPAFSGVLNVCEMYGGGAGDDDDALLHPRSIPAAPAPMVPPGLKQRFLPFGSRTPTLTCVAESELDAGAAGPSSATLRPRVLKHFPSAAEEEDGGMTKEERRMERKRRKRIKKESQDPEPSEGEVEVKVEPIGTAFQGGAGWMEAALSFQDGADEEEERRRKKKKRKKEKEKELEATPASEKEVPEEVKVKREPVDFSYEDLEGSAKKKKKKRKSRAEEA